MTHEFGHPISSNDPEARPSGRRKSIVVGLAAGVVAGALIASGVFIAAPLVSGPNCPPRPPLRVIVAPELSPVVSGAVNALNQRDAGRTPSGSCPVAITVVAQDPATTAADLAGERSDRPDVWIPDSSVWTRRATAPGTGVPSDNPSLASSPVVLAMARRSADIVPIGTIVPAANAANPTRWTLPEPESSAVTVGALIELQDVVAGLDDGPARFGAVVRGSRREAVGLAELSGAAARKDTAVPATEQQVFSYNRAHPETPLSVAYAPRAFRFDYPMVVLTPERERRDRAAAIVDVLRGEQGQRLLTDAGFRTPDAKAGTTLTATFGAAADRVRLAPTADASAVNSAIRAYTSITRPTRLLAAIDVSGSMANLVPGTRGMTRLDLAVMASVNGLAVYSDDTVVGVWEFATNLTAKTDYRVLAPLQELGGGTTGQSGRQRIAEALAAIRPTRDRTGLNDTILAGVREVRRHWDPRRVNSMVVITDGGDSDRNGISTEQLITTLRAEADPERPVTLFSIAYGPNGDVASLQRISAVTGGRAYAAPDPRQIGQVLADAIGRRSCSPDC